MSVPSRNRTSRASYHLPSRYRENRDGSTPVVNEAILAQTMDWTLWSAGLELPLSRGIRQIDWRTTGKSNVISLAHPRPSSEIGLPRCKPPHHSPCLCPCPSLSPRLPKCSARWPFVGVYSVHRLLPNVAGQPFRVLHLPMTKWWQGVIAFRNAWDLLEER